MARKISGALLVLLGVALTAGCSKRVSIPVEQAACGAPAAEYPFSQMQPGKGMIIFLRPGLTAYMVKFAAFANGEKLGPVSADSFRVYQANAGPNVFQVRAPEGDPTDIAIDVQPGKVYFILAQVTMGAWVARVNAVLIPCDEGLKKIKDCTEIKRGPKEE